MCREVRCNSDDAGVHQPHAAPKAAGPRAYDSWSGSDSRFALTAAVVIDSQCEIAGSTS
jgi:hypothetical protein